MLNNYNFFKLEKYFFFSKIPIISLYLNKLIISNISVYSPWYLILCEKGIPCSSDGCRVIIFITIMWIITPMMEGGLCSKKIVHNPQKVADKTIADRKLHYGLCIFNLSTLNWIFLGGKHLVIRVLDPNVRIQSPGFIRFYKMSIIRKHMVIAILQVRIWRGEPVLE